MTRIAISSSRSRSADGRNGFAAGQAHAWREPRPASPVANFMYTSCSTKRCTAWLLRFSTLEAHELCSNFCTNSWDPTTSPTQVSEAVEKFRPALCANRLETREACPSQTRPVQDSRREKHYDRPHRNCPIRFDCPLFTSSIHCDAAAAKIAPRARDIRVA